MPYWVTNFQVEKPYQGVNRIYPLKQHKLEALIEKVKQYPSIEYVVVFGSATEERCTPYSDIDILIKGARNTKFYPPNNDVYDIIYAEGISPDDVICTEIERDGVIIYESKVI